MKRILFALTVLMLAACAQSPKVTVTVANSTDVPRIGETVELSWAVLAGKLNELTAENVVVTDVTGMQVPSQVVYEGGGDPRLLIFQVSLEGQKSAVFEVKTGERKTYKVEAYGRFVPERKDDYAWENNVVAFRAYGPALEVEQVTPGIDYWSKSTSDLVIDAWYEKDLGGKGSYHVDAGEGCDVYKVGPTLGMGASSPVLDGKLVFPDHNFSGWKTLDNGPIRTSVQLTYAPFPVGTDSVSLVKTITLDAGTHFNRVTDVYSGTMAHMDIAAGVIIHDEAEITQGDGFAALYEPASDSKTGGDGMVAGAVILPDSREATIDGTLVRTAHAHPDDALVYYSGAATSKRDMKSAEQWFGLVAAKTASVTTPLQVTIQ